MTEKEAAHLHHLLNKLIELDRELDKDNIFMMVENFLKIGLDIYGKDANYETPQGNA
jgi:hypothetical protein